MAKLEDNEEEVEGKLDFDGGDKVSYVTFVDPCVTLSVSSLASF